MRKEVCLVSTLVFLACARAAGPAGYDAARAAGGRGPGGSEPAAAAARAARAEAAERTSIPATPAFAPAFVQRLRARIAREAPAEVAVALVDLATGRRLGIADTVPMHAASTMKVPVMLELFRQADAGRFSLDDSVVVKNEFTSIADGSRYSLSPGDDSEHDLYAMVGRKTTLRDLVHRMITMSSNLATNILIEMADPDSIRATLAAIGADGMRVLRGVEDIPAFRRGMNNTTTAGALARVLEFIARCEAGQAHAGRSSAPDAARTSVRLSAAACREMTDILDDQHFTEKIPAGVPRGVRVANKTGWITGIDHDGAIVYPPGRAPYVLVVLTRGFADRGAAAETARDVSRLVWEELTGSPGASAPANATARALLEEHGRFRVDALTTREFTHGEYWRAVGPIIDESPVLEREEVGRSVEGRPIYAVRYGHGATRVLLWSQMHGNESTATMALADLFRYLTEAADDPLPRRLAERLTVVFVPMLNPDGAERFQRRNAYGIDVNRDARMLVTPEARTLKAVQEEFRPDFGFNLHDQNVRTRVGRSDRTAAIALLAPRPDASGRDTPGFLRAQRVAAIVRDAIEPLVGGHITRYDDTFNPRAFGDLMQQWGVSTVLIESGGWQDDPEKQYLRATNFIAIRAALDAIATGAYADADPGRYLSLERNGRAVNDLLVMGGTIVLPGRPPFRADLAIDFDEPLERRGATLVDVGDLREYGARDTLDVAGLYLHIGGSMLDRDGALAVGSRRCVAFTVRTGADPTSPAVGVVEDGRYRSSSDGSVPSRTAGCTSTPSSGSLSSTG
ncbi:MAG TPA: serine hydrolase [Longimicrobiales bacterium]